MPSPKAGSQHKRASSRLIVSVILLEDGESISGSAVLFYAMATIQSLEDSDLHHRQTVLHNPQLPPGWTLHEDSSVR